jgi:hypothetical protein
VIQATICESAPNKVLDEASFNLPDNKYYSALYPPLFSPISRKLKEGTP